jgi:uncharacterized DUF497 family protein
VDAFYQYRNETFVWDAEKAANNLSRHGVSFKQACEIFADPMLLLEDATANDELRHLGIGITLDWKLTCVVHVVRENNHVRIISARRATAAERDRYEDNP